MIVDNRTGRPEQVCPHVRVDRDLDYIDRTAVDHHNCCVLQLVIPLCQPDRADNDSNPVNFDPDLPDCSSHIACI